MTMYELFKNAVYPIEIDNRRGSYWLREKYDINKSSKLYYEPSLRNYLFCQIYEEGGYEIAQNYQLVLECYPKSIVKGNGDL